MTNHSLFWGAYLAGEDAPTTSAALEIYRAALFEMPNALDEYLSSMDADPYPSIPLAREHENRFEWTAYGRTWPQKFPLADGTPWAVAAVSGDQQCLDLLDSYTTRYALAEPVAASTDWTSVVERTRKFLDRGPADIKDVRKTFSREDRIRFRDVWRALQKNGEILIERRNGAMVLHAVGGGKTPKMVAAAAAPVVIESLKTQAFRAGEPEPARIKLLAKNLSVAKTTSAQVRWDGQAPSVIKGWPEVQRTIAPRSGDEPCIGHTRLLGRSQLILTHSGNTAAGRKYQSYELKDLSGETVRRGNYPPGRVLPVSSHADAFILFERDAQTIHVGSETGDILISLNIRRTPEWASAKKTLGSHRTDWVLKDASASIQHGLIALAFFNRAFVYRFDGSLVGAFQLGGNGDEYGIETQRFAPVEEAAEWIYGIDLSPDGQKLYVGGYSGIIHEVELATRSVLQSWKAQGPVTDVEATADGCRGKSGSTLFEIDNNRYSEVLGLGRNYGSPEYLGDWVIFGVKKTVGLFNRRTREKLHVQLPMPLGSAYSSDGRIMLETRAACYTVPILETGLASPQGRK